MRIEVDVVADMTVYNPFDFFIEESSEIWPFEYVRRAWSGRPSLAWRNRRYFDNARRQSLRMTAATVPKHGVRRDLSLRRRLCHAPSTG